MTEFRSRPTYIATILLILTSIFAMKAQDLSEAQLLLKTGEPGEALGLLKKLAKEKPKDGKIQMLMGDCYVAMDSSKKAISAYREAQKKGENDAWLSLARLAIMEYRIQDADEDIELYRKGLKKGRKTLPDNSRELDPMLTRTRNMLARVEKIAIIDSMTVDEEDFFKYYRLTGDCGKLSSPASMPAGFVAAVPSVVYTSPDGVEMIWATEDKSMNVGLVSSSLLYGGEWESPTPLGDQLNEGGDANYPFLLNDGVTLYFANDGENSLGGYDIFISRRNDEGVFFQPQNIGMPFNSPYNDYMLAIDEQTGVGWWATDRNRIPGKVTIYTFIPSEMRVNYDVDDPRLASLARVDSYKDSWSDGADYSDILRRIKSKQDNGSAQSASHDFILSVPGRGVYTSFSHFRNPEAAQLMRNYLSELNKYNSLEKRLTDLRRKYGEGDHSVDQDIRSLEKEKIIQQKEIKSLKNQIIKVETL